MSTIPPVTANEPEAKSADLVNENLAALRALFPQAFTEGGVNFEALRELLGDAVDEGDERYGLNWSGKRQARRLALTPSLGTLRPAKDDSVDWPTTKNLMIEGDNLEVLKLLQKSYAGQVKLIYIDPPYNTGNDFVYPDDYADSLGNYMRRTGQANAEGVKNTSNPESSGRYHTEWLNMMLPRLMLASRLLHPSGLVAVSVDEIEYARLCQLGDEVFGEDRRLGVFVWKSRVSEDTRSLTGISEDHEYIVLWSGADGVRLRGAEKDLTKFSNDDADPRGPWRSADLTGLATKDARPNLHYEITDPKTGLTYPPPPKGWRFEPATMAKKIAEGRILFPRDPEGRPRQKLFLEDIKSDFKNVSSLVTGISTADGTREVNSLVGAGIFSFPKPVSLIQFLIEQAPQEDAVILDFFAGSGTTGHAVMAQNATDGGDRRYILVQLPERLDPENRDQKTAADFCDSLGKPRTIAELTKERLRRAAIKVKTDNPETAFDGGFRAYKLATSNLKAWTPGAGTLQSDIENAIDNLTPGRTEEDLMVELLLKQGIDLTEAVVTRDIGGHLVHTFGGGVLVVCLADIATADAQGLADRIAAWIDELNPATATTLFFKDSGFEDNQAKANLAAILSQRMGERLLKVRSL